MDRYPAAVHLPPGFDDSAPLPEASEAWDLVLVGRAYPRRVIVLQAIQGLLKPRRVLVAGPGWAGKLDPAVQVEDRPVLPEEKRALWRSAKVVLQIHRDAFFENPRRIPPVTPSASVFEAAGLGCCQVVDASRPGLGDHYRIGEEVLAFEAIHGLPALLEGLLADPNRRRAVGEAARKRTLAEHALKHRLAAL